MIHLIFTTISTPRLILTLTNQMNFSENRDFRGGLFREIVAPSEGEGLFILENGCPLGGGRGFLFLKIVTPHSPNIVVLGVGDPSIASYRFELYHVDFS